MYWRVRSCHWWTAVCTAVNCAVGCYEVQLRSELQKCPPSRTSRMVLSTVRFCYERGGTLGGSAATHRGTETVTCPALCHQWVHERSSTTFMTLCAAVANASDAASESPHLAIEQSFTDIASGAATRTTRRVRQENFLDLGKRSCTSSSRVCGSTTTPSQKRSGINQYLGAIRGDPFQLPLSFDTLWSSCTESMMLSRRRRARPMQYWSSLDLL
ncbi:hypothetical protein JKP88DRAFT_339752 [Tribonema minus]|uniref:Secreted protein n=1 Tax=Tribonema minus TaxID=303371 RepID=A0A835YGG8_9STRA|nr:hypothetical protein JKP88DRAFT_339752 [Tribonema minus]